MTDKHSRLDKAVKKWITEKFDQKVLDSSALHYRSNDEITCSQVIGATGTLKGILTAWEERGKVCFHFDKR